MPTTPYAQSRGRVLHDSAGDALGTASNPLAASVASGSGGVTEYTEDAAAAANPIGGALILVRRDTLTTGEVTTDGDNVAAKATSKGELHTRNLSLEAVLPASLGGKTAAASFSTTVATDETWLNNINGGLTAGRGLVILGYNGSTKMVQLGAGGQTLTRAYGLEYETVAAGQTAQAIGATGATGDYLSHVMVQPTSVAPGVVTVLDLAIEVHAYPGGTVAADLLPFRIDVDALSVSGAWKITTGANVKCTAYGDFT